MAGSTRQVRPSFPPEGSVQPHPFLGILGGDGVDLSQHPVSDHLFGLLQNGVVGITVRHAEQKIFFLGQGLQLLRLPAGEGDGFVADNVEAVGNDVLDDLVVGVVGGGHHHKSPAGPPRCAWLPPPAWCGSRDRCGRAPPPISLRPPDFYPSGGRNSPPSVRPGRRTGPRCGGYLRSGRRSRPRPLRIAAFFIERPPDGLCKVYKKSSSGYHAGRQVSNSIQSWTHSKGTYKREWIKKRARLTRPVPLGYNNHDHRQSNTGALGPFPAEMEANRSSGPLT